VRQRRRWRVCRSLPALGPPASLAAFAAALHLPGALQLPRHSLHPPRREVPFEERIHERLPFCRRARRARGGGLVISAIRPSRTSATAASSAGGYSFPRGEVPPRAPPHHAPGVGATGRAYTAGPTR